MHFVYVPVSLPLGVMDWPVICFCGIVWSWTYSLVGILFLFFLLVLIFKIQIFVVFFFCFFFCVFVVVSLGERIASCLIVRILVKCACMSVFCLVSCTQPNTDIIPACWY